MTKRHIKSIIVILLLIITLSVQGCQWFPEPVVEPPETVEPAEDSPEPVVVPPVAVSPSAGQFTLRYDSKSTLNPITGLNRDNLLLSALLYESLFVLDGSLNVEPVLCENWSTEDNTTYLFEIKSEIAMSNDTWLTADDVVYSLRQAILRGRFVNRLTNVASVSTDGELRVKVVLRAPNSRFINLLDIPIIKSGSIENRMPPGTGPYVLTDTEGFRLERFSRYRDYHRLPMSVIYLIECRDDELTELFDDGEISLLLDDPFDAFNITLNRLPEKRYFETTTIQFIGFNAREGVMRDPDVRRAIGCSIDRALIVGEIMSGQAVAAPLPISPYFKNYDKAWEHRDLDPLTEMTLLLTRARMGDFDEDSYLEISDGFGNYSNFTVDFIVNSENIFKVQAANVIADTLRQYGFRTNVRELPWDAFLNALKTGNFDMYYGETTLGADFDLSPLVLPGPLNYGGTASTTYKPFIEYFLSAEQENEVWHATSLLLDEVTRNAPFVPILYKRYVMYSQMGAISGAQPGQSNAFRNLTNWTINYTMLK